MRIRWRNVFLAAATVTLTVLLVVYRSQLREAMDPFFEVHPANEPIVKVLRLIALALLVLLIAVVIVRIATGPDSGRGDRHDS